MIKLSEFLWVAGGAGSTLLLAAALVYWIVQEARAGRVRPEAPSQAPPTPASGTDTEDRGARDPE